MGSNKGGDNVKRMPNTNYLKTLFKILTIITQILPSYHS